MMPHMDGVELIRQLAASDALARVPVILMSAAAHAPALEHPHAQFRRKPLSIDDLIDAVKGLIGSA
jgi:CheY-like chemotaxis protein